MQVLNSNTKKRMLTNLLMTVNKDERLQRQNSECLYIYVYTHDTNKRLTRKRLLIY